MPVEERSRGDDWRVGIKEDWAICSRGPSQRGVHNNGLRSDGGHGFTARRNEEGEVKEPSFDGPERDSLFTLTQGGSEQLAATSESWSGELRAAEYGTEPKVPKHTARADAIRLAARPS